MNRYDLHPAPLAKAARMAKQSYEAMTFRDHKTDTEVFCIGSWFSIRGTELEWQDIRRDLNAGFMHLKEVGSGRSFYAHHGFSEAAQRIVGFAIERQQQYGALDVIGHSLGGAVAVVLATLLNRGTVKSVTTFAGPRAIDQAGVKILDSKVDHVVRVVNAMDVVTTVPWAVTGFRHPGSLLYLTERGHWWNPSPLSRAWMRYFAKTLPVHAHSIALYEERLTKFGF